MANADKIVGEAILAFARTHFDRLKTDRGRSKLGRALGTLAWQIVACLLLVLVLSVLHLRFAAILWFAFLGLSWVARRLFIVQRWVHGYRLLMASASVKYPGHRAAYDFWQLEKKRRAFLRKQFAAACSSHGLRNAAKQTPVLHNLKTLADGDMTAVIHPGAMAVKGGVRELRAQRDDVAAICGCEGGIDVKPHGAASGNQAASATLTFHWEKRKWPVMPIQQLPESEPGQIALGNDEGLSPATVPLGLSVLLVAMTGKGKSQAIWTILVSIATKARHRLFVVDPKGGQEMGALASLVGRGWIGNRQVEAYGADSESAAYATIKAAEQAMIAQQRALTAEGIRKWTPSVADRFPAIILVVDEMVTMLNKISGTKGPGPEAVTSLVNILSQGRAAGCWPVMATQASDKEILGQARTFIVTRVVLGTENAMQTGMAFGDLQAEANGAACSQIDEPGIGYLKIEGVRGYRRIRIAMVDEQDIADYVDTGMPANMGDDGSDKVEAWRPHWNYRYFTSKVAVIDGMTVAPGQLAYTGETNNVKRRHEEHVRDFQSGKRDQWMQWVDPNQRPLVTYAPSEKHAKAVESFEIANYYPIGNVMENQRSPWFRQPPVALPVVRPNWRRKTRAERRAERAAEVQPVVFPHRPAVLAQYGDRRPVRMASKGYPVAKQPELDVA